VSRYTKEHYEDVARVLSYHTTAARVDNERERMQWLAWVAKSFIDLFAADNPPFCRTCDVEHSIFYAGEGLHEYEGGFNRKWFLAACGLDDGPVGYVVEPSADLEQYMADTATEDSICEQTQPDPRCEVGSHDGPCTSACVPERRD